MYVVIKDLKQNLPLRRNTITNNEMRGNICFQSTQPAQAKKQTNKEGNGYI